MTAQEMRDKCAEELKQHDWKFKMRDFEDDGECAIDTSVKSECGYLGHYEIRLLFRKWDLRAMYYLELHAPEARRREVAEYLMRINWRKLYGKFTMDFKDGEIREELLIAPEQIEHNVSGAMSDVFTMMAENFDDFLPGLYAVVTGAKTPEEAYKEAVAKDVPPPPPDDGGGDVPKAVPVDGAEPVAGEAESVPSQENLFTVGTRGVKKGRPAKGKPRKGKGAENSLSPRYTLKGLNIQGRIPLKKIVSAVKKFNALKAKGNDIPRLKILLSGVPGTGKTAFAKYLANEVGMPLRAVKVSDIVSKWCGETEKGIARAFKAAKEKGELLFLDECDSFLQSRTRADHSWEVTQVNELLQQMEEYDGVMIAATNFADNLDKAVLRRFTYKLKLDYLTDEGKGIFFHKYFKSRLTAEQKARLNAIANLTPGDFRTVREELFYLGEGRSNDARLAALEAESEAKGRERAKIGFGCLGQK